MVKFISVFFSIVIVTLTIVTPAAAQYTYRSNDGESTSFSKDNTDLPYKNYSVYDNALSTNTSLGLQEVNIYNIGDMRAASAEKNTAPSVDELAQKSGDIINVNANKVLYGLGGVVDHINTKQITVGDFEAIMWSFIISQFATPYEDNLSDVLQHAIFQQMINQDLEITGVPDSASGTVAWNEVFEPNTRVVDKVKFAEVANTIKKNLQYRVLYDQSGEKPANLYTFLTSDLGDVFYIKDWVTGLAGADKKTIWDNRQRLLEDYEAKDIEVEEKLIPVYIQSNIGIIQNQANLGAFLKGQAPLAGTASIAVGTATGEPTFGSIVGEGGPSGTMGPNMLYVDSFGNICVYHENKMKIILCNAQNSLFTSRPANNETVENWIKSVKNSQIQIDGVPNLIEVPFKYSSEAGGAEFPEIYTDSSMNDHPAVTTNESMAVYSKPVLTVYSQTLSSGKWNADTSTHWVGNSPRNDFPGFLDFHREQQNSHRNQLVLFKPPVFNIGAVDKQEVQSGSVGSAANFSLEIDFANNSSPTYRGLNMKNYLLGDPGPLNAIFSIGGSNVSTSELTPTQRLFSYYEGFWAGFRSGNSESNQAVSGSSLMLFLKNLSRYVGIGDGSSDDGLIKSNSPWMTKYMAGRSTVSGTMQLDMMNQFNHMLFAGLGMDSDKMIKGSLLSLDTSTDIDTTNYTVGGALIPSFDYGQFWTIANEANSKDASISDIKDGDIRFISSLVDKNFKLRSGMLKPFNRIQWSIKEEDYLELQQIIDEYLEEMEGDGEDEDAEEIDLSLPEEAEKFCKWDAKHKQWINNHASDVFLDTLYLQLRDTRVSDAWVSYGKEEVSLIAYVWLNYYLPKSLFARSFIDGTYENSTIFKTFIDGYSTGVTDSAEAKQTADKLTAANRQATKRDTAFIDGQTTNEWGISQVILGPYIELHGSEGSKELERLEYDFYPDTSPTPAVVNKLTVSSEGVYDIEVSNHVTVNVYDLLMGLYRNTNSNANMLITEERGPTAPIVDKQYILNGLNQFLTNPATTIISWIVSLLQGMHRSMANGRFGDFFNVAWVTNTELWATVFQYYFIAVVSLVVIASIYLFFQLLLNKKVGLWMTLRRLGTSIVLTVIPVILINSMVYGLDLVTKRSLATVSDKAATAESAALITGLENANKEFEYNYQMFREQFDSLEDITGKYGYKLPLSYYESVDQFKYDSTDWQTTLYSTAWTSNQASTKWYDYRAFVPVQRDRYSENLYYYFYDYIKWQFLQYAATTPSEQTSLRIQDRAKEYVFGTEVSGDIEKVQEDCLNPDSVFIDTPDKAEFIGNLDKLMMGAIGDYAVMMQDPNYIYGESFIKDTHKRYGDYYLEDMFGLGYLLTDVKDGSVSPSDKVKAPAEKSESEQEAWKTWEVSDELYMYPGWIRFREHPSLQLVTLEKTGTLAYKNQKAVIDSVDEVLQKSLNNTSSTRAGRVYGSQNALYHQLAYNTAIGGLKFTELEKTLFNLNDRIYNRVRDLMRFFPASTPNEAYISLAAVTATFEFTREFGNFGWLSITDPLEPTGFNADTITLDSVLKGIFSRDISDILQSRELLYIIIDNAGGFGILPCILVVIADMFAFATLITRNVLMTLIFFAATILCIINYMIRPRARNKTILGIATQCISLVVLHLMLTFGMSLLAYYSASEGALWKDVMLSLILSILFAVGAIIHIYMLYIVIKDFSNFGGNIVSAKLDGLKTKMLGSFVGRSKFGDAKFQKMVKESEQDKKDPYAYNASLHINRLESRMGEITRRSEGTGGVGSSADFEQNLREGKYAGAVIMRRGSKVDTSCGATKRYERQAPNVLRGMKNGPTVATGMAIGSDMRFNNGATVSNMSDMRKAVKASTAVRELRVKKLERREATQPKSTESGKADRKDAFSQMQQPVAAVAKNRMSRAKPAIDQTRQEKTSNAGRRVYTNSGTIKPIVEKAREDSGRRSRKQEQLLLSIRSRAENLSPEKKQRIAELRRRRKASAE